MLARRTWSQALFILPFEFGWAIWEHAAVEWQDEDIYSQTQREFPFHRKTSWKRLTFFFQTCLFKTTPTPQHPPPCGIGWLDKTDHLDSHFRPLFSWPKIKTQNAVCVSSLVTSEALMPCHAKASEPLGKGELVFDLRCVLIDKLHINFIYDQNTNSQF